MSKYLIRAREYGAPYVTNLSARKARKRFDRYVRAYIDLGFTVRMDEKSYTPGEATAFVTSPLGMFQLTLQLRMEP